MFDYGPDANYQIYGQIDPPLLPLKDYNVPTVLLSGDIDHLSDPGDVSWLSEQLGDKVVFQKVYHLNHLAFCDANDMTFFEDAITQL